MQKQTDRDILSDKVDVYCVLGLLDQMVLHHIIHITQLKSEP